jgi:hypothetical protein
MNWVDVMGRLVFTEDLELKRGIQQIHLPVSEWNKGVYFLRIYSNDGSFTQSVIKN